MIWGLALLDGAYDMVGLPECMAHVTQLLVVPPIGHPRSSSPLRGYAISALPRYVVAETITIAQEPLLKALHEVPREVGWY